jgi:hypothetical protein
MNGHAHPHVHSHEHSHTEAVADHSHGGRDPHAAGEGATVLDIGADVGALVLYASADLVGAEIEISPVGEPGRRKHVAVHTRHFPGGTAHAAVYPDLPTGSYELWAADGSVALTVAIEGGTVAESVWPQGVLAPR